MRKGRISVLFLYNKFIIGVLKSLPQIVAVTFTLTLLQTIKCFDTSFYLLQREKVAERSEVG